MIKIEAGKRYVRNDGVVTGVLAGHSNTYLQDPKTGNLYVITTGCRYSEGLCHSTSIGHEYKENNEMTTQDTAFVKTVTRKEIVEKKDTRMGYLNLALLSVVPNNECSVDIVVGANWSDSAACSFNKRGLTNLIAELTAIRDALK